MYRSNSQLKALRQLGFTLIELMATVAVIAVLAAIAVPSMTAMIDNSRLKGQSEEMMTTLQLARSEAIRVNKAVRVCPSSDGATCGSGTAWSRWIVMSDDGVIRDNAVNGSAKVKGPTDGVTFHSNGRVDTAQVVNVCMPVTNPPNNQREITVSIGGVISSAPKNGSGACP